MARLAAAFFFMVYSDKLISHYNCFFLRCAVLECVMMEGNSLKFPA
jgi:hypothetical protein